MKTIHLEIRITLNENEGYSWGDPKVTKNISLSLPKAIYNSKSVLGLLTETVAEMEKEFPAAKEEHEKEQEERKLQREREKAEEDAKENIELNPA